MKAEDLLEATKQLEEHPRLGAVAALVIADRACAGGAVSQTQAQLAAAKALVGIGCALLELASAVREAGRQP